MIKRFGYIFLCALLLLGALCGCSGEQTPTADILVGTWQSLVAEETTIEFKDDGTMDEYWNDEYKGSSPYEIKDDKLVVTQNGIAFEFTLKNGNLCYMEQELYQKK